MLRVQLKEAVWSSRIQGGGGGTLRGFVNHARTFRMILNFVLTSREVLAGRFRGHESVLAPGTTFKLHSHSKEVEATKLGYLVVEWWLVLH
jgi:hypothetical protein